MRSKLLSSSHRSAYPALPAPLLSGLYPARAYIKDKDRSVIEMIKIKMKLFFLRLTALHQLHPLHPSSQVCILPGLTKTYRVFNSASKCIEAQYILCANTKNTNSKIQISKGLREDTFTDLSILHLNALRHNTFNRQKKTKESSRVLMDLYLYSYRIRICI